jgi:hypothetical protein
MVSTYTLYMSVTTIFLRTPTLKLTIGQRNGLKSFMEKTNDNKVSQVSHAAPQFSSDKEFGCAIL